MRNLNKPPRYNVASIQAQQTMGGDVMQSDENGQYVEWRDYAWLLAEKQRLDTEVNGYRNLGVIGAVVTDMTRLFVGYKYFIDTTDLGTAITYSNPYLIGRLEYWYQRNKFLDRKTFEDVKGGGLGTGLGFGFEFPVELKASYIDVEFLYHVVNFFDKFTQDYAQYNDPDSKYGYADLTGNVISIIVTYNFTW